MSPFWRNRIWAPLRGANFALRILVELQMGTSRSGEAVESNKAQTSCCTPSAVDSNQIAMCCTRVGAASNDAVPSGIVPCGCIHTWYTRRGLVWCYCSIECSAFRQNKMLYTCQWTNEKRNILPPCRIMHMLCAMTMRESHVIPCMLLLTQTQNRFLQVQNNNEERHLSYVSAMRRIVLRTMWCSICWKLCTLEMCVYHHTDIAHIQLNNRWGAIFFLCVCLFVADTWRS